MDMIGFVYGIRSWMWANGGNSSRNAHISVAFASIGLGHGSFPFAANGYGFSAEWKQGTGQAGRSP